MESVYITGRGLLTPLGNGLAANEAALKSGKSGIVKVPEFISRHLDSEVGGMISEIPQTDLIDRKKLRFCPPASLMSVIAATEAFAEAQIPLESLSETRIALIGGVAGSNLSESHQGASTYLSADFRIRNVSPFVVPRVMPSNAVSILSLIFGMRGESYDLSAACSTSALAVITGARLIRSGEYDMVLVGGAEPLDWITALGFCACRALSKNFNDEPERASRPFDRDRDGFVISSGAAWMILESEKHLRSRGVRPITRISGFSANSNAVDMVVPDKSAICDVMSSAVRNAGLTPADIDYVNTHGTGTPVGDPIELDAIHELFGTKPAINSTKSQTGHMIGATGAAEIIFTSMMLEHGFLSPNVNLENPDPEFGWADLVRECREGAGLRHAISNSFAFGGSNAAVVLSKGE